MANPELIYAFLVASQKVSQLSAKVETAEKRAEEAEEANKNVSPLSISPAYLSLSRGTIPDMSFLLLNAFIFYSSSKPSSNKNKTLPLSNDSSRSPRPAWTRPRPGWTRTRRGRTRERLTRRRGKI